MYNFIYLHYLVRSNLFSSTNNENNENIDDYGLISIMYHRFNESKYPSTNIQLEIFKKQLEVINNENLVFIHPSKLKEQITQNKKKEKNSFNY